MGCKIFSPSRKREENLVELPVARVMDDWATGSDSLLPRTHFLLVMRRFSRARLRLV